MTHLTIEHLAPYIAYRVNSRDSSDTIYRKDLGVETIGQFLSGNWKMLLRHLSQLTQEIEHNGERFVPIVELLKLKYPKADKEGRYSIIDFDGEGYPKAWYRLHAMWEIILFPEFENYPLWIVKKLNEWHFDYMKLIEQGLSLPILGICVEKGCERQATTDYNGHGHYVCKQCNDSLNRHFDEEYR